MLFVTLAWQAAAGAALVHEVCNWRALRPSATRVDADVRTIPDILLAKARNVAGGEALSDKQKAVLQRMYEVGYRKGDPVVGIDGQHASRAGNYTPAQIRELYKIGLEAFTAEQVAKLIRSGATARVLNDKEVTTALQQLALGEDPIGQVFTLATLPRPSRDGTMTTGNSYPVKVVGVVTGSDGVARVKVSPLDGSKDFEIGADRISWGLVRAGAPPAHLRGFRPHELVTFSVDGRKKTGRIVGFSQDGTLLRFIPEGKEDQLYNATWIQSGRAKDVKRLARATADKFVKELPTEHQQKAADFLKGLGEHFGTPLDPGDLVTFKSNRGNHYIGRFDGFEVLVRDGEQRLYLRIVALDGSHELLLTNNLKPENVTRGIPDSIVGPGPKSLFGRDGKLRDDAPNGKVPLVPGIPRDKTTAAQRMEFYFKELLDASDPGYAVRLGDTGVNLGGNVVGAKRITDPRHGTAIAKTYHISMREPGELSAIANSVRRLQQWAKEGHGPEVYRVGYKVDGDRLSVTVIMEDMLPDAQHGNIAAYLGGARDLPREARLWIRDSLLYYLKRNQHGDGHALNGGWRRRTITKEDQLPKHGNYYRFGNEIIEVFTVDADAKPSDKSAYSGASLVLVQGGQYDPAAKKRRFNEDLGFSPDEP